MSNSCHEILREGIMVFSSLTKSYVRALWCFHLSLNDWCQGIYRSFTKKNLHLRKNELHDQQKELSAQGSIICQNYTRDLSPPFTCSSHLCHGHFISPISYLPRIWDTKKWRKVTFFHEKDLLGFQIYQQMEHKTVYSRCLQKLVKALNKQEWKLKETHLLRMLTAAIQQSSNVYIIFILLGIIFWSSPLV